MGRRFVAVGGARVLPRRGSRGKWRAAQPLARVHTAGEVDLWRARRYHRFVWLRGFVVVLALGYGACLLPDLAEFERCADGCGASVGSGGASAGGEAPTGGSGGLGDGGGASGGAPGGGGATASGGGAAGGAGGGGGGGPCDLGPDQYGSPGLVNPAVAGRCIDEMETPWQDYAAFLAQVASFVPSEALTSVCGWKGTAAIAYRPVDSIYLEFIDDTGLAMRPVQGIDWCDAATYCEWAGKELCGTGEPSVAVDRDDPYWRDLTEWARACSANDDNPAEAGCYVPGAPDDPMERTMNVDTPCVGSLGLHHTLSNVWEWESNCMEAGSSADQADDDCRYRGTPYADGGPTPECNWANPDATSRRDHKAYHVGFRCCWSSD